MNKKLKYILVGIALLILGAFFVWQYVNKGNADLVSQQPEASFTFSELIAKTNSDTTSLNKLKNKLVAVNGIIKKVSNDSSMTKIEQLELGDTTSESSITCDIDTRHQADFSSYKVGMPISIKGQLSGYIIDTDLGLGNTIQLKFVTINKN